MIKVENGIAKLLGLNYNFAQSRKLVAKFFVELGAKIYADEEGEEPSDGVTEVNEKTVVGLVVFAQHADGTIYFHSVGLLDFPRVIGMATVELGIEATRQRQGVWVEGALSRTKLEEGY